MPSAWYSAGVPPFRLTTTCCALWLALAACEASEYPAGTLFGAAAAGTPAAGNAGNAGSGASGGSAAGSPDTGGVPDSAGAGGAAADCGCAGSTQTCLRGACVAADDSPSTALTTNGTCLLNGPQLLCVGRLLGTNDDTAASDIQATLLSLDPTRGYRQLSTSAGESYCALTQDSELRCWGSNALGQLGTGDTVRRAAPVSISGGPWLVSAMGSGHACALDLGRALWCWGRNIDAELGLGDHAARMVPTLVDPGPWARVAVGWGHTCALRDDGSLWCWGQNSEGQLGLGDTNPRTIPTRVPGSTWVSVSSAGFHTCALDTAGAAYCWGSNQRGQLGLGDLAPRNEPTRVVVPAASSLATGRFQTCVISSGGSLMCWGAIDFAGDVEGAPVMSPQATGPAGGWTSIEAGYAHLCGVREQSFYCWGRNSSHELGLGDTAPRLVPSLVQLP